MHPHTARNRKALALLTAPRTAEEARRILAAASERMREVDGHPRPRRSFLRTAAKAGHAAARAAEGTALLLSADIFTADTAATLRVEAGWVHAMAAHLHRRSLSAVEGY